MIRFANWFTQTAIVMSTSMAAFEQLSGGQYLIGCINIILAISFSTRPWLEK